MENLVENQVMLSRYKLYIVSKNLPFNLSNVHFNIVKCKIICQERKKIVDHVYKESGITMVLYVMGRAETSNMWNICRESQVVVVERQWCCQTVYACRAYC